MCLEMALLEENEPLLTARMKRRGDTRTHPRTRALRSGQSSSERRPVFLRLLRVPDYGGVMPDNNVAETARSPPNLACLSARYGTGMMSLLV